MRLISKYVAVKALEITLAMLRIWLKTQQEIEFSTRGTRKNRVNNIVCQELEMKVRLMSQFNEAREVERKITKR